MENLEWGTGYINIYEAQNYNPLPVVLDKGRGVYVWDTSGNIYIDCLSAYSCLNIGHNHPRIIDAVLEQMGSKISVCSRAFPSVEWTKFSEKICKRFGFRKVLPMNTGAEAVETAIKVVRKWGHVVKGVPDGQQVIVVCDGNFHGRTTTVISFSPNEQYKRGFGPLTPGFVSIPFGNVSALEALLDPKYPQSFLSDRIVGFLVEPIQGEGGMNQPQDMEYFSKIRELCTKYNVCLIMDEIQTGLGRTGKDLAEDWFGVKSDITLLGKALGGGVLPISVVLDRTGEYMDVIKPGDHGSTFGGNPLACRVASETLDIIDEEKLTFNSFLMGSFFRGDLYSVLPKMPVVKEIRGFGLMNGVELKEPARPYCLKLMENGILCYYTKQNILRITPPLVINYEQVRWVTETIIRTLEEK